MTIHQASLKDIVELSVYSVALANERNPVSLLLVAPPESGKTEIILAASDSPWTHTMTDVTGYGLIKSYLQLLAKMEGQAPIPRLLLIPDLLQLSSRNRESSANVFAVLSAYIEEGVKRVHTYYTHADFSKPVCGGIVTALTPGGFEDQRYIWHRSGFLSRFLVVTYSYSELTQSIITEQITAGEDAAASRIPIASGMPSQLVDVVWKPTHMKILNLLLADYLIAFKMKDNTYGFRLLKHLRRLAQASALRAGRQAVLREDIERVEYLVQLFGNYRFTEV